MHLIIVESPTKARTLSRFLGKDYDVEATMGHIKDLPKSKLGIEIENNFKPEYSEVSKRKETIKILKSKSKKANAIYIASDPDREGEAIAAHVKEILLSNGLDVEKKSGKPNAAPRIFRIAFHEITQNAVEEAIANPRDIDTNLVNAQIGRRVLDRLVGYKLSPLLWKKVRRGLSAGRVQSVAVRLIVEREKEIQSFKADEYWEIFCLVGNKEQRIEDFVVSLVKVNGKAVKIPDKKYADEILNNLENSSYKVSEVRKREVVKNPYPPFTTSTMTQSAARLFGWSSKKTMGVAQKLYEEGLITYHRTDSLNINIAAALHARDLIEKKFGGEYLPGKPKFYKTKSKSAQEAHEAIRPTNVETELLSLDEHDQNKLYDLIWRRFIACQMNPSVFDETTVEVSANHKVSGTEYLLRTSGQVMKFDGWRRVVPAKKSGEEEIINLPEVGNGADLNLNKTWGEQKFTQPPARYNEASLIKTLEKLGIGRPSTYAPTISTIQVRNYVEKNDAKQFVPTNIGVAVNDFLISNFPDTFDYQFTALMEGELDSVAAGTLDWVRAIRDFWEPFDKRLLDVEKNSKRVKIEVEKLGKKCPDCDEGELVIRTGRFGKFISCSRFPDCKHTEKYLEKVGIKCPDCKTGDIIIKKSKKGKFYGCSRYPDCKFASWKLPKKEDK